MPTRETSRFSREKSRYHSKEKLRRRTLLCFTKVVVSGYYMDKRERGYHWLRSNFFCHTVPKNFVVQHLCVSDSL